MFIFRIYGGSVVVRRLKGRLAPHIAAVKRLAAPSLHLAVSEDPNSAWRDTRRGTSITFVRKPLIQPGMKVFTMGSCFAREVRAALTERGFDMLPRYNSIDLDPQTQKLAYVPDWPHLNHYNTFTIRDELAPSGSAGRFVKHDNRASKFLSPLSGTIWQDPHRKLVYASSKRAIADLSGKISACIASGIREADLFVITLGLTEVFRDEVTGRYLNQAPDRQSVDRFTFERSTYDENLTNMRAVCERLAPKTIVVTVSPVPLNRTFSGLDVVVANTESKSILRAVAGQIEREFDHVIYWPSYEIARATDMFEADGRNVTRQGVARIIDAFVEAHAAP